LLGIESFIGWRGCEMRSLFLILCLVVFFPAGREVLAQETTLPRSFTPRVVNWPFGGEGEWQPPEGKAFLRLRCPVATKLRRITLGVAQENPPEATDVLAFADFKLVLSNNEKVTSKALGLKEGDFYLRAAMAPSGSMSLITIEGDSPFDWEIDLIFLIPLTTDEVTFQFGAQKAEKLLLTRQKVRTWTDRGGRQLKGEFLGLAGDKIQIRRESDGKTFEVPLERFSDADQTFVRNETRATASVSSKNDSGTNANPKATLKVPSSEIEKGEFSVEIDWGNTKPKIDSREVTLVLLFQAKAEPIVSLNSQTLSKMSNNWELGLLDNGFSWVLRTSSDSTLTKYGEVLQVIANSDQTKEGVDFREGGTRTFRVRLSYTDGRGLNSEHVQIALFQETDPENWQQSSTNYQLLSNVVELKRRSAE
jgi:hypothetical protein